MPTAYSYLRFSSPEQAKGDSIRRQTQARDAWLASVNIRKCGSLRKTACRAVTLSSCYAGRRPG
jgi:hypothetical protein